MDYGTLAQSAPLDIEDYVQRIADLGYTAQRGTDATYGDYVEFVDPLSKRTHRMYDDVTTDVEYLTLYLNLRDIAAYRKEGAK